MARIMIAGTGSGCGKTTVICALLQAFLNRRMRLSAFKCGPDYIDPMFHREILGTKSGNLDGFFMDREILRTLLQRGAEDAELTVIEGVMGYYDGVGVGETASSFQVAADTETPVILVVSCKGMSRSIQAVIQGFLSLETPSGIRGVIFNQLPDGLYPAMQEFCESRGIHALGNFPFVPEAQFESRHLGLKTAAEISDLKEKMQRLACMAEKYLDLNEIIRIAGEAKKLPQSDFWQSISKDMQRTGESLQPCVPLTTDGTGTSGIKQESETKRVSGIKRTSGVKRISEIEQICRDRRLRIAVARDRAFCFYYQENLELLQEMGCELIEFSPLADKRLPEHIHGLLLGGGYPELYGRELEENETMRRQIRDAAMRGLPVHGECGGFLYLHRSLTDPEGNTCEMVGALDGSCHFTGRLQHFGYLTMTAQKDNLLSCQGDVIRAHEFHRFVSDIRQDTYLCQKGDRKWMSYVSTGNLTAGFPHIHYYANLNFAVNFVKRVNAFCRDCLEL